MLINFSLSNFLSFNERQTFSMNAGKSRKFSERIYKDKNNKLTKCNVIFGANASGKSNLIEAFKFIQETIVVNLPTGFTQKYYRQIQENKNLPSAFEVEILFDNERIIYGFSIILSSGKIQNEYMYVLNSSNTKKTIFYRDLQNDSFNVGEHFKKDIANRLYMYGEDSMADPELLFITNINHGKSRLFEDYPDLKILSKVYLWFRDSLTVSNPNDILTGYPYMANTNLNDLAKLLNALGTGIENLRIVEISLETIKSKIPSELLGRIISDLEKASIKEIKKDPTVMIRSYKEFFTFELDEDKNLIIKTIEFSHENKDVYFRLKEESDGTARLLDLLEILFHVSDNSVFVIDEMDRCLHPVITTRIVNLFLDLAKKRNTQLIFTTHESRLLATETLRNDEISFIVKNSSGESIINPLEKYQLRSDKKVYSAMFDGTMPDVIPKYKEETIKNICS